MAFFLKNNRGRASVGSAFADGASTRHGLIGGDVMMEAPLWKPSLNSYKRCELKAMRFASVPDIDRAIEVLWNTPELKGMPSDSPDGMTLIVPNEALEVFNKSGAIFEVDTVGDTQDLPVRELARLRHVHGM